MPPKAAPQSQDTNAPAQPASGQAGPKPKRPRRNKDQIATNKLATKEAKKAKEQKRVSDLQEIAALENKMVDEDPNDATPRPIAHQNPRPLRHSYAVTSLYADEEETVEETDGNREEPESVTEPPTDQEEPPKKKAKKAPKLKARTEIMAAHKAAAMEVDSEVEIVQDLMPVDDDKDRKASATSKSKFVPFVSHSRSCHYANTR
jgi:hypothetical protein